MAWLWHAFAILAPISLLVDPNARFYYDWQNHEWFVGYTGEFLRQHHAFPAVFNCAAVVGMPQPIFYGYLFFPAMAVLSAWMGAGLALRIAVLIAQSVQYAAVFACGRSRKFSRIQSGIIGAVVSWGAYSLSNLYNRAALTEYFAIALLTAGVCFALTVVEAPAPKARWCVWASGMCLLGAVGTHPPTAILGGALLLLLLGLAVWCAWRVRAWPRPLVWTAILFLVLAASSLGPWIYANLVLDGDLYILSAIRHFKFMPTRTDTFVTRFAPWPYDPAALQAHGAVSTPYVEAQIQVTLLLLLLANFAVRHRTKARQSPGWLALGYLGIAWFLVTAAASVSPTFAELFSPLAPYIQFPSRLVAHANIGLLVALMGFGRPPSPRWPGYLVWGGVLLLACVTLGLKLLHARAVEEHVLESEYVWGGDRRRLVTPGRSDSAADYAAIRKRPQLLPRTIRSATEGAFPVGDTGVGFGIPGDLVVTLQKPGWVVTNAAVFRWSDITVDGQRVADRDKAAVQYREALHLASGQHRLRWNWHAPASWNVLRRLAIVASLLMVVTFLYLTVVALCRPERPSER